LSTSRGLLQKDESVRTAQQQQQEAATKSTATASSSAWGVSPAASAAKAVPLRDILSSEAKESPSAAASAPTGGFTHAEVATALKNLLGVPVPEPPTDASSVWRAKEAPKTKSLREIQEEEAAREAEAAAKGAAVLALSASGARTIAVPSGPWARAAAKNVSKLDATPVASTAPKKSLRDIQVRARYTFSSLSLSLSLSLALSHSRTLHTAIRGVMLLLR
jgi:hypothetical protein